MATTTLGAGSTRVRNNPNTNRVVWWTVGIVVALALIIFFTTRNTARNDSLPATTPVQEVGTGTDTGATRDMNMGTTDTESVNPGTTDVAMRTGQTTEFNQGGAADDTTGRDINGRPLDPQQQNNAPAETQDRMLDRR